MIGNLTVNISAKDPTKKCETLRAFVNSPSNVRIVGVPSAVGKWKITKVYFSVNYPDNIEHSKECTPGVGVYLATVPGSALPGVSTTGYSVKADGVDEDGSPVTGYVLGTGDVQIYDTDGQITVGSTTYYLHLLDTEPTVPHKCDVCRFNGVWKIYSGTSWVALGNLGDGSYVYDETDGKWHNVTVNTDPVTGEKTTSVSQVGVDVRPGIGAPLASVVKTGNVATITTIDSVNGTTTATVSDGISATIAVGTTTTGNPGTSASVVNSGTSQAAVFDFTIPKGDKGDTGDAATVSVGTTTTGAAGTLASVTNSGTTGAAVLDFTIPKGDKGDTGDAATVTVGTTTTGAAGTLASVTNSGTTGAAVLDFTIPKGDKGDTGNAATVTVGTTTTGATGTSASVTNSGTTGAAVLDFTIPKGDKGDTGDAATVTVGTTTTGAAGTLASVTNSGTTGAAVLDFTIPKGDKGDTGDAATVTVGTTTTGAAGTLASVTNSGTTGAAVLDFTIPKGADGVTPVITSSKSGKTTTVFVNGETLATIQDGVDGAGSVSGAVMNAVQVQLDVNGILQLGTVLTDASAFDASGAASGAITTHLSDANHLHVTSSEQLAAISSGLTSSDKTKLDGIASGATNVVESTVSGWGFTKNTGTYSKPGGGIPSSDLESSVQTALTNARTPTEHASSHASNGIDAITPESIGAMASNVTHLSGDVANLDTSTCSGIRVVASDPETYTENVIYFIKESS